MFQSASSSKLNFRFVGRLILNHCECHNSVTRSAIEVHELLMERLFDKLSNKSGPISISHREGLQIIKICCCYFWWVLRHRRGHVIHTWDPGPCWRTPQICGEEFKNSQECPPPWPPPKETCKSSWRPIPSRLRVRFGIQKQPALKWTPSSHTESDMDALGMDGKII